MILDWDKFWALGGGVVGIIILASLLILLVMWVLIPLGVFAISGELQKMHGTLKRIEVLLSSNRPAAAPPPSRGSPSNVVPGRPLPNPFSRD